MAINFKVLAIVTFLSVLHITSFSQSKKFALNVYLKGLDTGVAELILVGNNNLQIQIDKKKVKLINGKFRLTGKTLHPFEAKLVINNGLETSCFYIDTGKNETILQIDSLDYPTIIKGSNTNNEYLNEYKKKMESVDSKIEEWYNNYWALLDSFNQRLPMSIEDSIQKNIKIYRTEMHFILSAYIRNHRKSYVALWEIYKKVDRRGYNLLYENDYFLFDKKLQASGMGVSLKKLLDQGKRTSINSTFPSFPVIDSIDMHYNISASMFKKYTLIDFWFSHCGPCITQFEELNKIYSKYNKIGFEILGISVDKKENKADWKTAINMYNLLWPQYWDTNSIEAFKLSINRCPTNFLIDCSGKIIAKNLEPYQVEIFLQKNTENHIH